MPLSEERRAQLDAIVQKMASNNESDDDIQTVVNDFKSKYADEKTENLKPGQPSFPATSKVEEENKNNVFTNSPMKNLAGVLSGAWDSVKRIPLMALDPLGTETARITGKGETDPLKAAENAVTGIATAPMRIGQQIATGTPENIGGAAVDTAMLLPAVEGGVEGAKTIGTGLRDSSMVRNTRAAAADALRHPAVATATTAADLAKDPWLTLMRGGEGAISKGRNALAKLIDPGPDKSVTRFGAVNSPYQPPSFEGGGAVDTNAEPLMTDVQALVERHMPNVSSATPSNLVASVDLGQSARDILSPRAQSMMDAMHAEANPVFKEMQAKGMFDRTNMPSPGTDEDLAKWMRGEGGKIPYATPSEPLPPNPNAGGRLVRPTPPPVDLGPMGPESVSLPDQPQPVVTMSPRAKQMANMRSTSQLDALENAMRLREQGAAAQRYAPDLKVVDQETPATGATVTPAAAKSMFDQMQENLKAIPSHGDQEVSVKSGDTTMKHTTKTPKPQAPPPTEDLWNKTDADLYKELAGKLIKTPHEQQVFDNLDRIMKMRASAMGRSYAAKGAAPTSIIP